MWLGGGQVNKTEDNSVITEMKRQYNSNDYKILYNFVKRNIDSKGKGVTALKGLTLKEIAEDTNLSEIKVRKTVFSFLEDGFLKEGIKKVRAKTYYICKEGLEELERLKN